MSVMCFVDLLWSLWIDYIAITCHLLSNSYHKTASDLLCLTIWMLPLKLESRKGYTGSLIKMTQVTLCLLIYRGYQRPTKPVPGDCGYYLHAHQMVLSHPTTNQVSLGEHVKISSCVQIQKGTSNCHSGNTLFRTLC